MKIKLNLRQKITLSVIGTAVLLFAFTIGYFSISTKKGYYNNAKVLNIAVTNHYAKAVEGSLNEDMALVRTLSSAFLENTQLPFDQWRELIMGMYKQIMLVNPHIDAIWDSWELSYLDSNWDKPTGRWLHIYYREGGKLVSKRELRSLDGDSEVYTALRSAGKETIIEPYASVLQTSGLMTSLTSPIYIKGKYIGLVSIDLFLGNLQTLINEIKPFDEAESFLISSKGTFIAHPDTAFLAKNITDIYPTISQNHNIVEMVKRGKSFSFTEKDRTGEKRLYTFCPVKVGRTQTPWSLAIVVPERVILSQANRSYNIGILVGVIGIIVLITIIILLANNITKPIKQITNLLIEVSKGRIDKSMRPNFNSEDEIAEMGQALSSSIDSLLAKTEFAKSIGHGKLDAELKLLSDEDVLGQSLLEMRRSLQTAKEDEDIRKKEDDKRRWVNEGLAKFGDILRQNNDNLSKLGDELIKNLVWYLKASLGGIFVKNEENTPVTYDLSSAFAYDRKRYLQKSFELGEGLIGTCAAERGTIYLKEIPQDYIEVTSGLGDANPNTILIIPLVIETEVLGVIEIAAFQDFDDFEIEFVEKLGGSIASTLRTVRVNQKTAELLEQSQQQAEEMLAQEEEMRQNMEELQATQEEAARKSFEMQGLIDALNASSFVVEYDIHGNIININDAYLELLGVNRETAIGKHHSDSIVMTDEQRMRYEQFWSNLRKGKIQKETNLVRIGRKDFTFIETYTPIKNINEEVYKILKVAVEISSEAHKD
ncbi:MAG: cache domain-containing protein [Bacteroidales bacterium]|nr:cache domain-containing protein [Bacteroidales bacterium]MDD4385296.1 cache domain-containing protein [Bacteroidales bacterium]MDY0197843.1 cache domain-containing protein [Tenuifilaceae bacterium]